MARTTDEPTVFALIEDAEGIDNAAEIAAVDGVAGLFFGPFDLSVALGVAPDDPQIQLSREKVYAAAKQAGLFIGDFPWNSAEAQPLIEAGAQLLGVGIDDVLFANAARETLLAVRRPAQHHLSRPEAAQ
jgi:4-hydroxy-2-oxoheptanedioate aldolase